MDGPGGRRNLQADGDFGRDRLLEQCLQRFDAVLQPEAHRLVRTAPAESQQLACQGLAALARGQDGVDQGAGALVSDPPLEQLCAALNDHEEVVEVVRHPAGDAAQSLEPTPFLLGGRLLMADAQFSGE